MGEKSLTEGRESNRKGSFLNFGPLILSFIHLFNICLAGLEILDVQTGTHL